MLKIIESTNGALWSFVLFGLLALFVFWLPPFNGKYSPEMVILLRFALTLGLYAFGGWFFIIPMLCGDVRKQCRLGNQAIEEIKSTFLTQQTVDLVLHKLAERFDRISREQISLQGQSAAEVQLDQLHLRLQGAKSDFWQTYNLVDRLGFDVKTNFSDYLKHPIVHDETE